MPLQNYWGLHVSMSVEDLGTLLNCFNNNQELWTLRTKRLLLGSKSCSTAWGNFPIVLPVKPTWDLTSWELSQLAGRVNWHHTVVWCTAFETRQTDSKSWFGHFQYAGWRFLDVRHCVHWIRYSTHAHVCVTLSTMPGRWKYSIEASSCSLLLSLLFFFVIASSCLD